MKNVHYKTLSIFAAALFFVITTARSEGFKPGTPKQFKTTINDASAEYTIQVNGTLDSENTSVLLNPYNFSPPGYSLNRSLSIHNAGPTSIKNPNVLINGRGFAWSLDELVERYENPDDSEAEKARAMYELLKNNLVHGTVSDSYNRVLINQFYDPIYQLNAFGFGLCYETDKSLAALWNHNGLEARNGAPVNHSTSVVMYDGDNHLFDANFRTFFLDRENENIVSEGAVAGDPDLVMRNDVCYPTIISSESRPYYCLKYKAIQNSPGPRNSILRVNYITSLEKLNLRPDETLTWKWSNPDKPFRLDALKKSSRTAQKRLYMGTISWEPQFNQSMLSLPTVKHRGLKLSEKTNKVVSLGPDKESRGGELVIRTIVPTIIIGGKMTIALESANNALPPDVKITLGQETAKIYRWIKNKKNPLEYSLNLNPIVSASRSNASKHNSIVVNLIWPKGRRTKSRITKFKQAIDYQVQITAMPSLRLGENTVQYTDLGGNIDRKIEIIHEWAESSEKPIPSAPIPLQPIGEINSLQPVFKWKFDDDVTSGMVENIHLQIFDREDLRWTVCNALEPQYPVKQIPKGETQWTPHRTGLLSHGKKYWWRMRRRSSDGVWSSWSKILTFTSLGPKPPINLKYTERGRQLWVEWAPNPRGTRPVKYEMHASSELGFTAYDKPYTINIPAKHNGWNRIEDMPAEQEITLVDTTNKTEYLLIDPESVNPVHMPAYVRIVAVDEYGARSESSAFLELPHPWIVAPETIEVKPETEISIHMASTFSLGKYSARENNLAAYHMKFWNREYLEFSGDLPAWLKLDPVTGLISGKVPSNFSVPLDLNITVNDTQNPQSKADTKTIQLVPEGNQAS